MSRIRGMDGDVTGLVTGGHVVSWDLEASIDLSEYVDADTIDDDSPSQPAKRKSKGATDWSGSVTVNVDNTDAAPREGASGTFTGLEETARAWSGPAIIESVSTGVEIESEDLTQYEISIAGNGVLTSPT